MWATAHIRGKFFAGFRTTSRCEGLHSGFGKYVSVLSNLVDFLNQFFRWLNHLRHKEIQNDYESSYGETVLQTQHRPFECSAAKLYTKSVFRMFRPMLEKACRCKVVEKLRNGSVFNYIICKYPKNDVMWTVSYCQENLTFACSCMRFESLGLACEHVLYVLIYLNILVMPPSIVLERWTKGVKDAVNAANASNGSQRDPAFVTTYVTLVERCKRMVNAAFQCGKPDEICSTNELVERQTERLECFARSDDRESSMLGTQTSGSVGNPPRVRRKGVVLASSSQTATGKPKRKTQKCGICGFERHNRKSCQLRDEAILNSQILEDFEMTNHDEDDFNEDSEDCNIDLVRYLFCILI